MSRWGRSRGGWGGGWGGYPPRRAKRAAPEHGVKVRKIGATWWGRAWVEALERMSPGYASRLARGRTYARAGRVHDLEVAGGRVAAKVTGSRLYRVTLTLAPLAAAAWDAAIASMAAEAVFSAKLLAGEMPERIDDAFVAAGTTLFPTKPADLVTACSCPDWANPCKHVAAVHYVLGEAFDGDPFLLFELRGRTKAQVLDALRQARGAAAGAAATPTPPDDGASSAPSPSAAGKRAPGAGKAKRAKGTKAAPGPAPSVAPPDEPRAAAVDVDAAAAESVPFAPVSDADYERPGAALAGLHFQFEPPAAHATILRALGPPPRWSIPEPFEELVAPVYAAAAARARRLAEPESEPGTWHVAGQDVSGASDPRGGG
jgi:uncharacterized Zn finger protein